MCPTTRATSSGKAGRPARAAPRPAPPAGFLATSTSPERRRAYPNQSCVNWKGRRRMSAEENKALIRRFNEEAFNGHSVEAIARFLGPSFVSRQNFARLFTAFPDFHRTKEATIAEGDKVVARYTVTGTHQGEYMGVPATGKK